MPRALPPSLADVPVQNLLGRWLVCATNLPFWRGRSEVSITYTAEPDGRWLDEVEYRQGKSRRRIVGYDRPLPAQPGFFEWRGRGWLAWCRSTWGFVRVAPDHRWVVTWFSRATLGVTPEGMDVYGRQALDRAQIDEILAPLKEDRSFSPMFAADRPWLWPPIA